MLYLCHLDILIANKESHKLKDSFQYFTLLLLLFLLVNPAQGQFFTGRLTIEIKIHEENKWSSFTSRDCMIKVNYHEGYFSFDIYADKVFSKDGLSSNEEFLLFISGTEYDHISFYGSFPTQPNYMFENPTQNVKGDFSMPTGKFKTELVMRTTMVENNETRMQLLVEKTLRSPPLKEGREILFMINGIMRRQD